MALWSTMSMLLYRRCLFGTGPQGLLHLLSTPEPPRHTRAPRQPSTAALYCTYHSPPHSRLCSLYHEERARVAKCTGTYIQDRGLFNCACLTAPQAMFVMLLRDNTSVSELSELDWSLWTHPLQTADRGPQATASSLTTDRGINIGISGCEAT